MVKIYCQMEKAYHFYFFSPLYSLFSMCDFNIFFSSRMNHRIDYTSLITSDFRDVRGFRVRFESWQELVFQA